MVDTVRTRSYLAGIFADNTGNAITPQMLRDFLASGGIYSSGAGAPVAQPASLFELYVDTTQHAVYIAINTGAVLDWKRVGNDWKLAGSWTFSINVTEVDFTGLAGYNELMVIARGITVASSGQRQLLVSTDNGSTYRSTSGDYITTTTAGVESNAGSAAFHITASALARSGILRIPQAGLSGVPKSIENPVSAAPILFIQSTLPINALRINNSAAGNLTAGSIYVMGR